MSTEPSSAKLQEGGQPPVRKYLFDRPFDGDVAAACPQKPVKTIFTHSEVETVREQAYESGFNAGQKAMMDNQQQYRNVLLSQLDQQLGHLVSRSQQQWKRQLEHLHEMCLAIMRKVLPVYAERSGLQEIEDVVTRALTEMAHEPRLVVRVSEANFDTISEKINAISEQKAYTGKVVVLSEPGLGPADCKIEWADGGVERDMNAMMEEIGKLVGQGSEARG